jgi:hypothetical protein
MQVQSPSGDTYNLYFDGRAETQGVLDADFWVPVDTNEQAGSTPCLYYPLTGLFQVVGSGECVEGCGGGHTSAADS